MADKGLISNIYKQLIQLNIKKAKQNKTKTTLQLLLHGERIGGAGGARVKARSPVR